MYMKRVLYKYGILPHVLMFYANSRLILILFAPENGEYSIMMIWTFRNASAYQSKPWFSNLKKVTAHASDSIWIGCVNRINITDNHSTVWPFSLVRATGPPILAQWHVARLRDLSADHSLSFYENARLTLKLFTLCVVVVQLLLIFLLHFFRTFTLWHLWSI